MPSTWWDNIQIKKGNGAGNVTEEQKNALIERAVATWEHMGIEHFDLEKIAFAIAMMGLESGFDPHAISKSKKSKERGLGQFIDPTWELAVKHYNDYKKEHYKDDWPDIDPVKGRTDPDAQIRVIGPWITDIWKRAGEIARDKRLKGYDQKQIAYGKWNKGQSADAQSVGDFLKGLWSDPNIGGYFDTTYSRAKQALKQRQEAEQSKIW